MKLPTLKFSFIIPNIFAYLSLLILLVVVWLVLPIYAVAKPMKHDFLSIFDYCAYALILIVFISKALAKGRRFIGKPLDSSLLFAYLGYGSYLSLFIMSSILCRRLNFCLLKGLSLPYAFLVLLALSMVLIAKGRGSRLSQLVAYPACLGLLLAMVALPLLQGAWLPLLALPGVFIVMTWLVKKNEREEALRLSMDDLPEALEGTQIEVVQDEGEKLEPVQVIEAKFKILPYLY